MGLVELAFTAVIYIAGAITEYESRGRVTQIIYYSDQNITSENCDCKK